MSLPSWECGLKYEFIDCYKGVEYVAPFVGVWIEIIMYNNMKYEETSLPSWECGLKYPIYKTFTVVGMSLPSWECGLKFIHVLI